MLVVMGALFRSIVVRNMTGSATRLTAGVQGRSLLFGRGDLCRDSRESV